jgi:thiamine biosynthesis protein ThiI
MYLDLMISVDELWLKGRNRPLYFQAIVKHIAMAIKAHHPHRFYFKNNSQRLLYSSDVPFGLEVINALKKIPGIASIAPSRILGLNIENLYTNVIEELNQFAGSKKTFRANVKRIDKRFPIDSMTIAKEVGHRVLNAFPHFKVELTRPDITLDIRILNNKISLSSQIVKGIGGLPWGTSGHGLTMLSGGFDSPVASFLMAKRGLRQSFVFFHSYPFVGNEVVDKIKNLIKVLAGFQRQTHLYIIPFGDIQKNIAENCHDEYRTIFFRRYMVETANLLCEKINAQALVTGDSLGQVSSQTIGNLSLIDKSSTHIIFRPLAGFNKLEVLKLAEHIGTHDISILPHDDACALFSPLNPVIEPSPTYWDSFGQNTDHIPMLMAAIDNAEIYSVNLQGHFFKKEKFSFDS